MKIKSTLPSFANDPQSTLYRVRRSRRMSVEELSRRSGVPTLLIRRCERTASLPHDEALRELSHVLGVAMTVLLGFLPCPVMETQPSAAFIEQTRRLQLIFGGSRG